MSSKTDPFLWTHEKIKMLRESAYIAVVEEGGEHFDLHSLAPSKEDVRSKRNISRITKVFLKEVPGTLKTPEEIEETIREKYGDG